MYIYIVSAVFDENEWFPEIVKAFKNEKEADEFIDACFNLVDKKPKCELSDGPILFAEGVMKLKEFKQNHPAGYDLSEHTYWFKTKIKLV